MLLMQGSQLKLAKVGCTVLPPLNGPLLRGGYILVTSLVGDGL
jgi:hypothetical protein